jgi:hypothetical protein
MYKRDQRVLMGRWPAGQALLRVAQTFGGVKRGDEPASERASAHFNMSEETIIKKRNILIISAGCPTRSHSLVVASMSQWRMKILQILSLFPSGESKFAPFA